MSAYFVPSRRFRKALRRAARRGVDVRLLMPGPRTDHPWVRQAARRFYGRMLRNGVQIFEYQPQMLHAKVILCDDWVSVGSSNLDRWAFRWNLEANQEMADTGVADAAAALFGRDFAASRASPSLLARARLARPSARADCRCLRSVARQLASALSVYAGRGAAGCGRLENSSVVRTKASRNGPSPRSWVS